MIIQFADLQKQRNYKENVVMQFLIGYYKDMQYSSGINIPYFVRARDTYNELIKNYKDLNFYYNKVINKWKNASQK